MGMAALGGCWWSIEVTPPWMQQLSLFLPTGWTMDAMHRLLSFGDDPVSVLPHLAALLGTALLLGSVAARKFRFV
jgi:ABC-type multidrug transport system permease subunit